MFNYGPPQVGAVFMVCGLVMTVFQVAGVRLLERRIRDVNQIAAGLGLMGSSLALLVTARKTPPVFALTVLFALGMAFVLPNLAALISKIVGSEHVGAALGPQNAANSLGQAGGPLLGGALFVWRMNAPYLLSGTFLVAVALLVGWKSSSGWRKLQERE